jgi:hypothetical protein
MGGREILLGLILAIVAYMIWLLWQMRNLNRRKKTPPARELREPRVMDHPAQHEPMHETPLDRERELFRKQLKERFDKHFHPHTLTEEPKGTGMKEDPAWQPENTASFARQAFMDGVAREMEQLREEVDALRGALSALREEVMTLREDFQQENQAARAAQNVSPLYNDAMQMAILGHDALTISERCGISRAEAELVVALVKNKDMNHS